MVNVTLIQSFKQDWSWEAATKSDGPQGHPAIIPRRSESHTMHVAARKNFEGSVRRNFEGSPPLMPNLSHGSISIRTA